MSDGIVLRFMIGIFGLVLVQPGAVAQTCPDWVGHYDIQGAKGIDVVGNHAYIVDRTSSPYFEILDISSPSTPVPVGSCDAWGDRVEVVGDYAYVAGGSAGLRVVDVGTATSPSEVGLASTPGEAQDVAVSGDYAYVADHLSGLRVIDISNPSSPSEVGHYEPASSIASEVAVRPPYVFMSQSFDTGSGYTHHLLMIDVETPNAPTLAGSVDIPSSIYDIQLAGDLVLVAADQSGLRIIDAADPAHFQEIGSIVPWGNIWGVAVSGPFAILANYQYRLHVVDISDPTAPVEVFPYVSTIERPIGAVVVGNNLYTVGRPDIFSIDCALSLYSIFVDGFESGDTSAWSSASP